MCTPPPKSDDVVRAALATEPFFLEQAAQLGYSPSDLQITPEVTRVALWRVLRDLLREVAESGGATFVPVPEAAYDERGLLLPELDAGDVTHANGDLRGDGLAAAPPLLLPAGGAMTQHPYKSQPDRAFWSRSVSRDFVPWHVPGGHRAAAPVRRPHRLGGQLLRLQRDPVAGLGRPATTSRTEAPAPVAGVPRREPRLPQLQRRPTATSTRLASCASCSTARAARSTRSRTGGTTATRSSTRSGRDCATLRPPTASSTC